MRARKKKHGKERLEKVSEFFTEKFEKSEEKELHVEIGCGKGNFITENAKRFPEKYFVGVEKISDVILVAAEKAAENKLENVKFMICDAKELNERFGDGQVDVIYLNFSDPWPKKGYYKRRLTYKSFLEIYEKMLKPGGKIYMKTDNIGLFEYSLESFKENGWIVENVTNDLHHSEFAKDNIMTEYEKNFSEKGFKINRLEAHK